MLTNDFWFCLILILSLYYNYYAKRNLTLQTTAKPITKTFFSTYGHAARKNEKNIVCQATLVDGVVLEVPAEHTWIELVKPRNNKETTHVFGSFER